MQLACVPLVVLMILFLLETVVQWERVSLLAQALTLILYGIGALEERFARDDTLTFHLFGSRGMLIVRMSSWCGNREVGELSYVIAHN